MRLASQDTEDVQDHLSELIVGEDEEEDNKDNGFDVLLIIFIALFILGVLVYGVIPEWKARHVNQDELIDEEDSDIEDID